MSTGELKDVENCSLLEGEDSVSKGGTQILWSLFSFGESLCSLPQALAEKIGGWLNQTMVGSRNGVLQFWSRCVQALGLTGQLLRRSYFERLHPFLVRQFIICFSIIETLATFALIFACNIMAMMVVTMVLGGCVSLIYQLLHYGYMFIVSVVKYIVVHWSGDLGETDSVYQWSTWKNKCKTVYDEASLSTPASIVVRGAEILAVSL
ncbi:hypothetical protein R1sor_021493 [Riccia sorocarpa]|uniref:Uncharacterized protein n=1 Tax=Riccia sorocarpa TaxID=122646 RepID=A0ABD3GJ29_9MARC